MNRWLKSFCQRLNFSYLCSVLRVSVKTNNNITKTKFKNNKGMKKIVMTMVALLAMTAAVAQQSDNNKERKAPKKPTPEEMTTRMAKDLNLTDEQKTKVQALNKEYEQVLGGPGFRGQRPPKGDFKKGDKKKGDVKKKTDANTEASAQDGKRDGKRPELTDAQKQEMKQHRAKRKEYDAKLKQILTDDQYKSYQQQHRRGHRGPRGQRPDND